MIIRVKPNLQEIFTSKPHAPGMSRREMIKRGLVTGVTSFMLPSFLGRGNQAFADSATQAIPGGSFTLILRGGPQSTHYFGTPDVDPTPYASQWGLGPGMQLIPNMTSSAAKPYDGTVFGATFKTTPFPFLSQGLWNQCLERAKTCIARLDTPDDGAAETAALSGTAGFLALNPGLYSSSMLAINASPFMQVLPGEVRITSVGPSLAGLKVSQSLVGVTTDPTKMGFALKTAKDLAALLAPAVDTRQNSQDFLSKGLTALEATKRKSDPNFADSLFNLAVIPEAVSLFGAGNIASIPQDRQARIAAARAAGMGLVSSSCHTGEGYDYHGATDPVEDMDKLAAMSIQDGILGMHLAFMKNGIGGWINCNSNGATVSAGTRQSTVANLKIPNPQGDSGKYCLWISIAYGIPGVEVRNRGSIDAATGAASDKSVNSGRGDYAIVGQLANQAYGQGKDPSLLNRLAASISLTPADVRAMSNIVGI